MLTLVNFLAKDVKGYFDIDSISDHIALVT